MSSSVLFNIFRLIDGTNLLIHCINRLINGITRLINGWGQPGGAPEAQERAGLDPGWGLGPPAID